MSKEPEESIDSQEVNAPEDSDVTAADAVNDASGDADKTVSEEPESAAEQETAPEDKEVPLNETVADEETTNEQLNGTTNEKILAIKSALKVQEEERQLEETKLHIADKVKRYKTIKETGEPAPEDVPEHAEQEPEEADPVPEKKKKHKKKKSKKKAKKKRTSLFPQKGDGPFEVIRKCVFLASSAIFVACLCLIADYFWDNYQNSLLAGDMSDIYNQAVQEVTEPTEETVDPAEEAYEYYNYLPNVENLLAVNPDVTGWISIPGTEIYYPVLQRKNQEDGNDYYLKRNIRLEEAHAGSIFMDYRNNFDYVIDGKKQAENSGNLIIYGHNMHDYSMFGSLKHYINNADYYSEHPIVELNSNYRKYQYKIFGFIVVDIDDETETRFDYWNVLDFADETAFYDYVNEVKRRTVRLTDVDVKYGDEILTLSTCNSTFSNGRLVLFARKLRDGEDLYAGTETSTANPNIKWPNSYYRWHKNTYDPDAEFVPYG